MKRRSLERGPTLATYRMEFDGELLRRGFWLYVWRIETPKGLYVYVGRTGDSSSPNAASPFVRIGRHLDLRPHAKGNSILKLLRSEGVNPVSCTFRMFALGPLFPEQRSMQDHRPLRDKMAALERAVADHIKSRHYRMLGVHGSQRMATRDAPRRLGRLLDREFPPLSFNRAK